MFTEPRIVNPEDIRTRGYVLTYQNGNRIRLYNGSRLGLKCFPNRAKSLRDREKALKLLAFELKKLLEKGWNPDEIIKSDLTVAIQTAAESFSLLAAAVEKEGLSQVYLRDLKGLCANFGVFLKSRKLDQLPIIKIGPDHIQSFLDGYKSSPTNYMNRRRGLASLFTRLVDKKQVESNPVHMTPKIREVPTINIPYKKEQLQKVMRYLQANHEQLYLCCLIMYGCMIRPHQEIRLLRREHFNEDFTRITLSGKENKSRRNRTVPIPEYVQSELLRQGINQLEGGMNIFSRQSVPFNLSYFNTAWTRIKEDIIEAGIITQEHTLYSFRHTAAVNMYLKTKDPFKIQQAFGHSSLRVTLTYLRNLGLMVDASLDDLPELPY
jgi:integrase